MKKQSHSKSHSNIKSQSQNQNRKHIQIGQGFVEDAYDTTASVGRMMSWVSLFIGCLIGLIIFIIGIYLVTSKSTNMYDMSTTATVTSSTCNNQTCTLNLTYIVNDKTLTGTTEGTGVYNVGQTITIKYSSQNPANITTNTVSSVFVGSIMIFIGLVIFIGSCIWFYFVQNNKTVAAISGVGNIAGIMDTGFNNFNDN